MVSEKPDGSTSELETEDERSIHTDARSKGTAGVHDLLISTQQTEGVVPRTGKYTGMRMDPSKENKAVNLKADYPVSSRAVRSFIRYCETDHVGVTVNPYPILHQILYGNLIVKNRSYNNDVWVNLTARALELYNSGSKSRFVFNMLILDNCQVEDETLAQVIGMMIQATKLKRLLLINMSLGPKTTAAILSLNRSKRASAKVQHFGVDLRDCRMVGFEERLPNLTVDEHPLLSLDLMAPILNLSLVSQQLRDGHLQLLLQMHPQLEYLNISYNEFTTDGVIQFL